MHQHPDTHPYEGDDCMFYAAKDALLYFKNQKLGDEIKNSFHKAEDKLAAKYPDKIFQASIKHLLNFLNEKGVYSTIKVFPEDIGTGEEVYLPSPTPSFPALIITFSPSYGHVWFSAKLEDYKSSYLKQRPPNSMLYAIASLEERV